ncbi:hypothetical protein ACRALDRAFT_206067 [Sodiomyces alcalophilus JCM 7366]|uniref:uncharacterized protein n=1 Tax=Sodiomyces alcalophilus JCM 7366 TaxID=591952 RepID=UPI0039B5DE74
MRRRDQRYLYGVGYVEDVSPALEVPKVCKTTNSCLNDSYAVEKHRYMDKYLSCLEDKTSRDDFRFSRSFPSSKQRLRRLRHRIRASDLFDEQLSKLHQHPAWSIYPMGNALRDMKAGYATETYTVKLMYCGRIFSSIAARAKHTGDMVWCPSGWFIDLLEVPTGYLSKHGPRRARDEIPKFQIISILTTTHFFSFSSFSSSYIFIFANFAIEQDSFPLSFSQWR